MLIVKLSVTAESQGKHFLYRTGAAFVSSRLGIRPIPPITASQLGPPTPRKTGGLILAGSYVPKTTAQLKVLTDTRGPGPTGANALAIIEMDVADLIASPQSAENVIRQVVEETETNLQSGTDTLVMTSRKLITGQDELDSLAIGARVAEALVRVLQLIQVRPRYIIAKVRSYLELQMQTSSGKANGWCLPGRDHLFRRRYQRAEYQARHDRRPGCAWCTALAMRRADIQASGCSLRCVPGQCRRGVDAV
jgi:hypothetical protein